MKKLSQWAVALLVFAAACTPKSGEKMASKRDLRPAPPTAPVEVQLPEMTIAASKDSTPEPLDLPVYQASAKREHDLIHEKIELKFDWPKAHAIGKATLTLRPFWQPTDRLTLDAKGFDIQKIYFENTDKPLLYDYDGLILSIKLGKTFTRKDEYKIVVEYVAKPDERSDVGGSAAITSDKGLFFINPRGEEKDKPMQIWTQGETESNSRWMPTIDKPNERATDEIILTVEDKYKTLSNGLLVSSVKNADGSRTDHWKMDMPHAPYLFMFAVGDFAVVKDKWRDKELSYYVEPAYEKDAKAIFPYTPEMLDFYSNILDLPFPWPKYAQIVVRDYVSGAMENTTAVLFGEFMQAHSRELLDADQNELTTCHEMFHHWFGDLVTCESWSNLTLNEGFANYSEYLWTEHKHGREEADHHLQGEMDTYFGQAADGGHDLIDFNYADREAMFDSHSYNKGGSVLHMLRNYVGDEAFFTALHEYLEKNKFTAVEADELRMAFEDVTGEDLNWFWNQWFFNKGFPQINASWEYDGAAKKATLTLAQVQDVKQNVPIFKLPMAVDVWQKDGSKTRHQITMDKRKQQFVFETIAEPALLDVDADRVLLAQWNFEKSEDELVFQYQHAASFFARDEALAGLSEAKTIAAEAVWQAALNDNFWSIRQTALSHADLKNAETAQIVAKIAENDPKPSVRAEAITALGETGDKNYLPILKKGLSESNAYSVVGASLAAMAKLDPAAASEAAKPLENDESPMIKTALLEIYAQSGDRSKLPFFQNQLEKVDGPAAFSFFDNYNLFLKKLGDAAMQTQFLEKCYAFATDKKQSQWRRFGSTKSLADTRNELQEAGKTAEAAALTQKISDIKSKETDEVLLLYYNMF